MKKIISSISATLVVVGLTACGGIGGSDGSSSSTNSQTKKVAERDYIMIFYHYPKDICESSLEQNLEFRGTDFIVFSETVDVNCETYGKSEGETCTTLDYASFSSDAKYTCVIGMNRTNSGYSKSIHNRLFLEDMQEAVIRTF